MDTITIEGMDEHDFRYQIEDMLRADKVDEAIARLCVLLEPYARDGSILPRRFLDVSAEEVRVIGWDKLAERLHDHDRPFRPISAIGVALADYRNTGSPGPNNGRLAPFVKTFYFSDEAYPFSDATRDDLLDGYTREGFGWQGDYQATDATLAIRGIDDLYGAIVELENRLFDSEQPSDEEIHAGTIGACFISALIHQALRGAIREKGLPRPLCVLAACDGVFPFFDAPVAGLDECTVVELDKEKDDGPQFEDETNDEPKPSDGLFADISLLQAISRKGVKSPVLALNEEEVREAARQTELAGAQRMFGQDEHAIEEMLHSACPAAEPTFKEEEPSASLNALQRASDSDSANEGADWPEEIPELHEAPIGLVTPDAATPEDLTCDIPDATAPVPEDEGAPEKNVFAPPSSHSLRARVKMAGTDATVPARSRVGLAVDWLLRALFRR